MTKRYFTYFNDTWWKVIYALFPPGFLDSKAKVSAQIDFLTFASGIKTMHSNYLVFVTLWAPNS